MEKKNSYFDGRYLAFGACMLRLLPQLPQNRVGSHVGDQLFRCATSVGAHLQESRAAESRADFIHKMQMALKEMREAKYWLALIQEAGILKEDVVAGHFKEASELVAILSQSVITAKANRTMSQTAPQTSNLKS